MAEEYINIGYQVDILASSGSAIKGATIIVNGTTGFPQSKKQRLLSLLKTWTYLLINYKDYYLIQNFGRLLFLLPIIRSNNRKLMCYQRKISSRNIKIVSKLLPNNLNFFGCSNDMVLKNHLLGNWRVIYNPIKSMGFQLQSNYLLDSPLIFLSRIDREKGCHIAIEVAKMTNNRLIIAGNKSSVPSEALYFDSAIKPNIDGKQIVYVGELDDEQKNFYLGKAKAMLFPILWDEPFGIVMIESMICGTPVIAFNRGSVNEVIDEGITGFKVNDKYNMADALSKISSIDRKICHEHAKKRFDISVIASQYLSVE